MGGPMKLMPHQRTGARFARAYKNVIIADEPGLGKTAQAIVATWDKRPLLVVCPNSLKWFWVEEFEKWMPGTGAVVNDGHTATAPDRQDVWSVYITHWESLRKWWPTLALVPWEAIIVDESHKAKNRKAQQTRSLKKLVAPMKVLLTGTPIINRPDELWSQLHFLFPKDHKYRSYWRWFHTNVLAIERPFGGYDILGLRDPEGFVHELQNTIIRRTKEEVLPDLPEKLYTTIPVDLGPEQREAYDQMRREYLAQISDDVIIEAHEALSLLTRLRQLAIGLGFFDPENKTSAKVDAIADMISNWPGKKVVVCSQFIWPLNLLIESLENIGVNSQKLSGDTPLSNRESLVKAFQNESKPQVLAMTSQVGGVGLTLTAADTLIFCDKPWAPAYVQQAEDRLHRIGQKNAVHIVTVLARRTVETKIERLLEHKQTLFDQVFTGRTFKEEFLGDGDRD